MIGWTQHLNPGKRIEEVRGKGSKMKTTRMTPDGKYEILTLRFKDFDDLPRSLLICREQEMSFGFEE
jgi:hypothetical protein